MRSIALVLSLTVVTLASVSSSIGGDDEALELPLTVIRARMEALFDLVDEDRDKQLSRDELTRWVERVGQMSKNR